jgi:hypothetical protein
MGNAFAHLREDGASGEVLLRVDVAHVGRYIEPRKHSAFGALAFCELPAIFGTSPRIRLTAVPQEWLDASSKLISLFSRFGFTTRFDERTIEIQSETLSPSVLLRRAGLIFFALDSFSREHCTASEFEAARRATAKEFGGEGEELLLLLDDATGASRLKQFFSVHPRSGERQKREGLIGAALARIGTNKLAHFNCGSGQFLKSVAGGGQFQTIVGVEPSAVLVTRARLRLKTLAEIYHGSLLEPPSKLESGSVALLIDALPVASDMRLDRAAEVLFGELGFEFVFCVEAGDSHRWTPAQLRDWASFVKDKFSYQESLSKVGEDHAVLFHRRADCSRRAVRSFWEPEISTKLGLNVRVELPQWKESLEAFSKWTVDPRWLIYLPSGLCSLQSKEVSGFLEHPKPAFDYYRAEGISKVVAQFKHMGSRAIVIVCKDEGAGERRFGKQALGSVYTRNGRPFWEEATPVLSAIRDALTRARFWERFKTDWVCLDGELLPWALKAEGLIEDSHGELLRCGEAVIEELGETAARLSPAELQRLDERKECYRKYRVLHERYQAEAGSPFHFAPFHLIATEERSYFDQNHNWHMEVLRSLVRRAGHPLFETLYRTFSLDDERAVEECCRWWEELSESGAEGLVVKPFYFIPRGRRGWAQPGIKCRGSEHLRMVYGPEYDLLESRWELASRDALKRRREKHRRVLKQFALSLEGVERFLRGEPTQRVEACVRGVLSLER